MSNLISIIYSTCSTKKEAESLAEKALQKKLAACVNILPGALSIYEWEGRLEKNEEHLLLFKTTTALKNKLLKWLSGNHPYSLPALLASDVETSPPFKEYIEKQTDSSH
ncbi:MAG TPA: divalent-cation tolerance protein CutA [Holosporales bacterium]|nr:divalent-cation tolerance protein CutA [Holosporales bacterium]